MFLREQTSSIFLVSAILFYLANVPHAYTVNSPIEPIANNASKPELNLTSLGEEVQKLKTNLNSLSNQSSQKSLQMALSSWVPVYFLAVIALAMVVPLSIDMIMAYKRRLPQGSK